ncbi:MAG: DNA mismatch repair protein MutS [candidate division Zixibacteria bacterium]|nr:DNA mismatch repair protein MutS [candidate division Zixibacteria bacterium]
MRPTADSSKSKDSPMMRQFYAIKEKHPDKILFFRMGDFYEMFGEDAIKAAPILGIALTSRSKGNSEKIPLAGVPYHSYEKYLAKLLEQGEKVVIVEQVEDPKEAKGLVKREIVEILTPGTAAVGISETTASLCLVALCKSDRNKIGLAALDISTGTFLVDEGNIGDLSERLKVLEPSEILYPDNYDLEQFKREFGLTNGSANFTKMESWNFESKTAQRELTEHFGTSSLDGFGLENARLAIGAAGAIFRYLKENHRQQLSHINKITRFDNNELMALDYSTVRNLELIKNISNSTEENTLFSVMNRCYTAAGARRLQSALLRPFKVRARIERRLSGVAELIKNNKLQTAVRNLTKGLPDLEKLGGKLGIGKLNPRQMSAIKEALKIALELKSTLENASSPHLIMIGPSLPDCSDLIRKISEALTDEPPLLTSGGKIIRRGFSSELDDLNDSIKEARLYIASLQKIEREKTGINTLRVGFNKVFGYYLEVTRLNAHLVPDDYIRKQTLVNAERYITPELKEKESLIFSAEEKIFALESRLYQELVDYAETHMADIMLTAELLAEIDLVSALADVAVHNNYCRPEIFEDTRLEIKNGRHPVIEAVIPSGSFVANDLALNSSDRRQIILTGPNMSGKSTYLRQIGHIIIMAQIGSFVPADSAEIGLVDRVFTRVGTMDNLARGQSTFLVEMIEAANILNNATDKSVVLLDEVGRGTSTFDGLSVAWAVAEFINDELNSRTIFATHYHELTGLAQIYEKIHNYQVSVKKWEDKVVFLHKIIEGGCDDSYGIEVARLAGLPRKALSRARQILKLLESGKFIKSELGREIYQAKVQTSLFDRPSSKVESRLKESEIETMTPVEAFNLLQELKEELN